MDKQVLIVLMFLACLLVPPEAESSDAMTQDRLQDLILEVGADVLVSGNTVRFTFDGADLFCISDVAADRMRIFSPIAELSDVSSGQLLIALSANFHSVLDARYAVSDGVIYSAFIHPLGPLSEDEVFSAIRQVAAAGNTFGDDYTSGELYFGGDTAP